MHGVRTLGGVDKVCMCIGGGEFTSVVCINSLERLWEGCIISLPQPSQQIHTHMAPGSTGQGALNVN